MIFPNHERMVKLSQRVTPPNFIQEIAENPIPYCHRLTDRINTLFHEAGDHPVYLLNLLWLASHLRIQAAGTSPALVEVAQAIHYFLEAPADQLEFKTDLEWLCFAGIQAMISEFGPQVRRHYISEEEQKRVDDLWLSCFPETPHENDLEELKLGAEDYARRLEKISNEIHLPEISTKIRFLIERCDGSNEEGQWAQAALKYLLIDRDVLPDSWGYLGLLDDITVIKKTCEMINESALWHPLLEHFLNRWPFLGEISFAEAGNLERMSAFLTVAGGITLDRLNCSGSQSCLVVSERGPLALLGALFVYLSLQADQPSSENSPPELEIGDDIELWSPGQKIKARFDGFDEKRGMKVKLATSRRGGPNPYLNVCLMPQYYRFLQKADCPHSSLSTHHDFNEYKKSVQPDLMAALLGHRTRPLESPPLLLIMRRNKLREMLKNCKPMGQPVEDLLGLTYITRRGKLEQWGSGRYNFPQLLACSEPLIAQQLLEGELETGLRELPRFLLVDGPALLPDDRYRWKTNPATLVFAEVAEREEVVRLQQEQFRVDYLTAEDTIWRNEPAGKFKGKANYLISYMWRQHLAPHVFHHTEEIKAPILNKLHNCFDNIRSQLEPVDDMLDTAIEAFVFLRRAEKHLLRPNDKESTGLREMLDRVLNRAGGGRQYHSLLQELWAGLQELKQAWPTWPFDREQELRNLLRKQSQGGRWVGILLPARFLERVQKAIFEEGECVLTLTPRELEHTRPLDMLIIPFWPGRAVMRLLQSSGFGTECIYLFFPHEHRRLNNLRKADDCYRKRLRSELQRQWGQWQQRYQLPDLKKVEPLADLEQDLNIFPEKAREDIVEENPDFDTWLESHTRQHVKRLLSSEQAKTTAAHLVLFDSPLYFFFAAPKSRVLCVNDILEHDEIKELPSKPKYLRPFSHIVIGDVLAFPMEDREDVIDDLADRFIEDARKVRRTASIWRDALRECYTVFGRDLEALRQHLTEHGLVRGTLTLHHWLGQGHVVAPRSQNDLALIAQITGHARLNRDFEQVSAAIDQIYVARRKACIHFLRQIKHVDIEEDQEIVEIDIAGKEFHFRVLQVAKIGHRQHIPYNLVGRLQNGRQILKHEDHNELSEEVEVE